MTQGFFSSTRLDRMYLLIQQITIQSQLRFLSLDQIRTHIWSCHWDQCHIWSWSNRSSRWYSSPLLAIGQAGLGRSQCYQPLLTFFFAIGSHINVLLIGHVQVESGDVLVIDNDLTDVQAYGAFASLIDFFIGFEIGQDSIVQNKPSGLPA